MRSLACCAILAAAGVTGLIAGIAIGASGSGPQTSKVAVNLTANDAISFRFPADWVETGQAHTSAFALASADSAPAPAAMLDPQPTRYTVASAGTVMPVPSHPAYAVASASAMPFLPSRSAADSAAVGNAAVANAEPVPLPRPAPSRSTQTASLQPDAGEAAAREAAAAKAAAHAKMVAAAAKPKPESNAVLNNAQIASIKKRLNLTPDQERYWPAVEAELRKMEYVKGTKGTKNAQIDTSKMNVAGLREAGFPLVMSFSSEQRNELRSLAHLLGLEKAMSGI